MHIEIIQNCIHGYNNQYKPTEWFQQVDLMKVKAIRENNTIKCCIKHLLYNPLKDKSRNLTGLSNIGCAMNISEVIFIGYMKRNQCVACYYELQY